MKKQVERHLRNYKTYKVAIKNLEKQLDYIMPNITATYELIGGSSGTFNIESKTEKYAIDRIESKRALDIHEKIEQYNMIIDAIDNGLEILNDNERKFVEIRYINNNSILETSIQMGYSERNVFKIRNKALKKMVIVMSGILRLVHN